jgi:uncharacterized protein YndB with AHSA1/START domain
METRSIEKQVTINAPDYEVWDALVNEAKIEQWAAAFGEGTHAETDWAEGSEILWKDGKGEVVATGIITIFRLYEVLHVDFYGKTNPQMKSPTGRSSETYTLRKMDDRLTVLQVDSGPMSDEHLEEMDGAWEKAVEKIKQIAEGNG